MHLCPGTITDIAGVQVLEKEKNVRHLVLSHVVGDCIENSGTVSQVFGYLHLTGKTKQELRDTMEKALGILKVLDENQENMLYSLYDEHMLG